ncbi:MAG: protein kinase [Kofleriaceae bacterium]
MEDASGITADPRIGSLVDERYRVLEAMASGSMGVVYKAERVPVGKIVAIKFLHATFANDAEFLARFERETRVMSKLTHPHCVSVVDFGVWDGAPYLVMEYVSGTTLRALIDNGPLPPRRALTLVRQIAAGLAHAHAQGVVHRDVKPANLMISEEIGTGDHARILDFGLARLRGAVGRDATQTNVVVGTPNYMAPEQTVGGGLIDARTDIYAVGIVLFEMISGDRPFQAEDTLALLGMHRAAPIPRLTDRVPADLKLPRGLQELVEKAMAKSPGDRFQSAIELAAAIDEVAGARTADEQGGVIRHGTEARHAAGKAPTMLDVSDGHVLTAAPPSMIARVPTPARGSWLGTLILLVVLAGGAGAAVWWIKRDALTAVSSATGADPRPDPAAAKVEPSATRFDPAASDSSARPAPSPAGSAVAGSAGTPEIGSAATGSAVAPEVTAAVVAGSAVEPAGRAVEPAGSAVEPAGSMTRGSADAVAIDAGVAPADHPAAHPAEHPAEHLTEHPSEPAAGSDIEMDPATAVDPAPASTKPANDADEAANAPATAEEAAKHVAAAPVRATTLASAVQLITDGKRDLAIASLRALWTKTPASAYIPFLLGNLYYDQRWWSVAMDHYAAAIKKNAKYRANPTLNRNVIRMLASTKTSRKAQGFLKYSVGKPALPYVRYAALHDPSAQVRKLSGWLARNI